MSKIAKKSYFSSSLILPFYKTSDHLDLVLLGKYAQPTAIVTVNHYARKNITERLIKLYSEMPKVKK